MMSQMPPSALVTPQQAIWKAFCRHVMGLFGLGVVALFCLVGIYAPLFASGQPLAVYWDGAWYFPLVRYLFFAGYYTKQTDLVFNVLMFTAPLMVLGLFLGIRKGIKGYYLAILGLLCQLGGMVWLYAYPIASPTFDASLLKKRQEALAERRAAGDSSFPDWHFALRFMSPYARLEEVVQEHIRKKQYDQLKPLVSPAALATTLYGMQLEHEQAMKKGSTAVFWQQKRKWLDEQKIRFIAMPLMRPFHWQEDAGGSQQLNQQAPWWDLTRPNRKDLVAALIFGVRTSLVVGVLAVGLALFIGVPIGAAAGYRGGVIDLVVCRILEVWEAMPTFFVLLLVISMTQSKSIFLVIAVIGLFGWTSFSRYIRGEMLKQRSLAYVEAAHSLGFSPFVIMFREMLPNAIAPLLTLLPFAIMGAITSEAGLSFLGLGEEGSGSWGILMDEGRAAFPGESYLLWPPALLLTLLLVAIALVGDAWRDALDPRLRR